MKKQISLLLLAVATLVNTTPEFRSPITLNRGSMHWPTIPIQNAWWFDQRDCRREECEWQWNVWSSTYYRAADKAYINLENRNKNTRKTASLAALFFGKESFRGEEGFAQGIVADPALLQQRSPLLGAARISPRFDYNESGAYIGGTVDKVLGCEGQWHIGGRASIPFVVIEIEQNQTAQSEETLADLIRIRNTSLDGAPGTGQDEFAVRSDLLSSLVFVTPDGTAFNYLRTEAVTGNLQAGSLPLVGPTAPAFATANEEGEFPLVPFRRSSDAVTATLPVTGVLSDGTTARFGEALNYQNNLLRDRDVLSTLFLVPSTSVDGILTPGADTVRSEITALIDNLRISEPVSEFYRINGIDIAEHERIAALGDAELEIYGGYGYRDEWFVDGLVGLRLPTGKRQKDAKRIFFQPTGHNGHVEIKLGLEGGYRPINWFALKADASFHHAFERTEHRAAPFAGATIQGIGPDMEVDVSWNYFVGHLDLNFFHPWNDEIGWVLGYEFYGKKKDNVSFKDDARVATDLLGRINQPLDATVSENNTNAMSHKIRTEVFHRWDLFEIFAGASHVFAGRNVMKETGAHLGFTVYF